LSLVRRTFATRDELAKSLATAVAADLAAGIAALGTASLAVSGGSTPAKFFAALSEADIAWDKVVVTLVDERWVDESSDRSNGRLVRANLLRGKAAAARVAPPHQVDVVILGMGNDGHTASFFPGGDNLGAALNEEGPVVTMRAPGAGEPRVTLTLRRLLAARALYLHIEGEEKVRTLDTALGEGPVDAMPVRAVLRQTGTPLTIYWCP